MQRREFVKNLVSLPLVAVGAAVATNAIADPVPGPDEADGNHPVPLYVPGEDHPALTRLMKHTQAAIDALADLAEAAEAHEPGCHEGGQCDFCEFANYDVPGMRWTLQTLLSVAAGVSYSHWPQP